MTDLVQTAQDIGHSVLATAREASSRAPGTPLVQSLIVGILVWLLTRRLTKKRYCLPPGPRPLPLLGNLLLTGSKEEHLCVKLEQLAREKYGPIITIHFGPVRCITLNDLDTITEALVQKGSTFAGRPFFHSMDVCTEGSKDIALADPSPAWKLHRKIAAKAIRHYMTGTNLEKVVYKVMAEVADQMAAESGAFDPHLYTATLMFHILHCVCFGEVKPYDDPSIQRLIENFEAFDKEMGNGFYEDIVPLLKFFPTKAFRRAVDVNFDSVGYFEEQIRTHRENFSPDNLRDLTDSILLAQKEAECEESAEVMAMFTDVNVRQTISDLFTAGVDTTRSTLDWALLYLAGHPEVQKRAQAEVDAVTGTGMPSMEHRECLQYTQAVVYEIMRLCPVVPTSVPHKALTDATIGGYDVPKDTMVMVNIWAVTHDPRHWDQPHSFRPQRFLDDQGKLKPLPRAWLPFSVGRRMCLGESVAKPELLLLLACFLKRLTFTLPEGVTFDPASQVISPSIYSARPFKIVATPR